MTGRSQKTDRERAREREEEREGEAGNSRRAGRENKERNTHAHRHTTGPGHRCVNSIINTYTHTDTQQGRDIVALIPSLTHKHDGTEEKHLALCFQVTVMH